MKCHLLCLGCLCIFLPQLCAFVFLISQFFCSGKIFHKGWLSSLLKSKPRLTHRCGQARRPLYKEVTLHTINRLADILEVPATELLEDVSKAQAQNEIEAINSTELRANANEER